MGENVNLLHLIKTKAFVFKLGQSMHLMHHLFSGNSKTEEKWYSRFHFPFQNVGTTHSPVKIGAELRSQESLYYYSTFNHSRRMSLLHS